MINDKVDKVMKGLFDSPKNSCQNNLESMKGNKVVFDYIDSLYYKSYNINLNHRGSYIDSPGWTKDEKAAIAPINKEANKCLQYFVKVALNQEKIIKDPQRITKIKPFTSKYNWEGISFPSEKKWEK